MSRFTTKYLKKKHFRDISNRLYNFTDIKITSVKLLGFDAHADLQNVSKDTSTDVTVIIPQLYEFVKTYDQNSFENLNAEIKSDREDEIEAQNGF